jgi:hypothetical protein
MAGLVEATMSRISDITMIGKTTTATDITIRSEVTATLLTQVASAAGMKEALVVVMAEASAAAMVVVAVTVVAAGIVSRETVQLSRSNHA